MPSDSHADLLIVGASARAAAFSALRSGFLPYCLDAYGDADLAANAFALHVEPYPQALVEKIQAAPKIPALYVGAVENHAEVLAELAGRAALAGNRPAVVDQVRDPFRLSETLRQFRLPCLEVVTEPPPRDGHWLIKPTRSAGGRLIAVWDESARTLAEPHYFQQRASGISYSAVFVAPPDRRDVRFVGMTRQLTGSPELNAGPFQWCGSVGPETLSVATEMHVRRIGNLLSWHLELCGLFGIDFILGDDGLPYVTEVNPRYTGSVEVLEHALGLTLIADHCEMFGIKASRTIQSPQQVGTMGKFILYADRNGTAPLLSRWLGSEAYADPVAWSDTPRIADIPRANTPIRKGQPVCTLFTTGSNVQECLDQMPSALQRLRSTLTSDH